MDQSVALPRDSYLQTYYADVFDSLRCVCVWWGTAARSTCADGKLMAAPGRYCHKLASGVARAVGRALVGAVAGVVEQVRAGAGQQVELERPRTGAAGGTSSATTSSQGRYDRCSQRQAGERPC